MLKVTVAWRGNTGAVRGAFIGVHAVTVIVAIIQVSIAIVGHMGATRNGDKSDGGNGGRV